MPAVQSTAAIEVPGGNKPTDVIHPDNSMEPTIATTVSDANAPPTIAIQGIAGAAQEELSISKKRVNVTVTILSISGLFVRDGAAKKRRGSLMPKKFARSAGSYTKMKADDNGGATTEESTVSTKDTTTTSNTTTTIVASFSRVVKNKDGKPKTVMTHVPSLPLQLPSTTDNSSGAGKSKMLDSVIQWPEQLQDDDAAHNKEDNGGRVLSSYQFQCTFEREEHNTATPGTASTTNKKGNSDHFVPHPFSIQLAISRSGRMFKLGTVPILLSGEENGKSSINVPITNCNLAVPKNKGSSKLAKVKIGGANKEKMIPMVKLKGDTLKCGLDPKATLRVVVHVSEPIGETLKISPNLTVTMIPNRSKQRQSVEEKKRKELMTRDNGLIVMPTTTPSFPTLPPVPSATTPADTALSKVLAEEISYSPAFSAQLPVVKSSPPDGNTATTANVTDDAEPHGDEEYAALQQPILTPEEEGKDKESSVGPSCTSSAYMSATLDDHIAKSKEQDLLSTASTVTSSDVFSMVSSLTDRNSWQSQTGIEVIPFRPSAKMIDEITLPVNPRLGRMNAEEGKRCSLEEDIEEDTTAADTITTGLSLVEEEEEKKDQGSVITLSTLSHAVASTRKSWAQRFTCGFPICGVSSYRGGVDDNDTLLSAVNEEDVVSTRKYSLVYGKCGEMEIQPSDYTEDDNTSVDDGNYLMEVLQAGRDYESEEESSSDDDSSSEYSM